MEDGEVYEEGCEEEGLSPFHEYGLSFDYVEGDEDEDTGILSTGFYRYCLSWGGPSDEVRFYRNGTIEYRYHDWFDGAGVIVTGLPWAQWLEEFFTDVGCIDWIRDEDDVF
jgi:hypothetical protein